MAKKDDISIFERIIIMMFGIGVVLAGLYPLTRQYGGIREFVKSKTARFEKIVRGIETEVNRAQLADPKKVKKIEETEKKSVINKSGDNLDNKDRKELDGLIENIWK